MPVTEKMSKLTVALNKKYDYAQIAEVEFNMADYKYGKYNGQRLYLS